MIDSYQFGEIVVDGKKYHNDLIILPDKIIDNWWREKGHLLQIEDLKPVIDYQPDILVIGTGANGLMKVDQGTDSLLQENNIKPIIEPTGSAWKTYNQLAKKDKSVAAAFHLTC